MLTSYCLGICGATFLDPAPWLLVLPVLFIIPGFFLRHRAPNLVLTGFFFLLGLAITSLALGNNPGTLQLKDLTNGSEKTLLGRVARSSRFASGELVLDLEQLQVQRNGQANGVQGRLRLQVKEAQQNYLPGAWLLFRVRLKRPTSFGIPGEFNRPLYLASQGIFATASLNNERGIATLSPPSEFLGWEEQLLRTRANLINQLSTRFPERSGKLLRALLLGDKSGLDDELRDKLGKSGLAHLFSVSGLHLGLVAGFLYLAGTFFWRRSTYLINRVPTGRIVPLLTLPALWCYMVISGAAIPTQRAFLMAGICAGLLLIRRQTAAKGLLTVAAFGLLLSQPLSLFSPSFQLSLAGLWGICYLLPIWRRSLDGLPFYLSWPGNLFLATLAATLCTFPFSLIYFNQASTIGPFLNLLAIPAIGFLALPLGLAGLLLLHVDLFPGGYLLDASDWVLATILRLMDWLLSASPLTGLAWYPDPLQLTAVLALVGMVLVPRRAGRQRRPLQLLCLALAILLCLVPNQTSPGLQVTSLSVGQGEATLLTINGERHYLIDGGGFRNSSFDVGRRLLAPALGRLGVAKLDQVVLTHNHPDHSLGLGAILRQTPAPELLTAVAHDQLPVELTSNSEFQQKAPFPGWQPLAQGTGWMLQLFAPDQSARNLNDRSLVVYAGVGSDGVLLTGDLERAGVSQLLDNPPPGPITLLKLPHHGSRHSNTGELLSTFRPQLAFVSAGRHNPFGLPDHGLIEQIDSMSIPLYRTDRDGSVQFRSSGLGWQVKTYNGWLFH